MNPSFLQKHCDNNILDEKETKEQLSVFLTYLNAMTYRYGHTDIHYVYRICTT